MLQDRRDGARVHDDAPEVPQRAKPALAGHAAGGFRDDAVHAPDHAHLVTHRVVRDVEIRLLEVSMALDAEEKVTRPVGLA
jgi:hypothetical protein